MSQVFGRSMLYKPPVAVSAAGCYIFDDNGKKYLDACGGAAVSNLGHANEKVTKAIETQLAKFAYTHSAFFTSQAAENLAQKIIAHAPENIKHVYLVSGGSEAVEAAIKLARQYFLELGKKNKRHIIARQQSYHGNTLGALACGGNMMRRKQFEPLLIKTSHISPCYEYRGRSENESVSDYGLRVANELESEILKLGADNVMAFIAEPVVGATLGAVPAVAGYFGRIKEICQKYEVLLILDEVMCGMGRTGTLFACEQENISADIICIAKGLGGGYQAIGAMLCSDKIYQTIKNGSGAFQHGHTYLAHPTSAAAAGAVLEVLIDDGLLNGVTTKGNYLQKKLSEKLLPHKNIGDIRGRGLFIGIEFVENKQSKKPFAAEMELHKKIKTIAQNNGLLCYAMGGTIDGNEGDHILLAPPYIINESEMDFLVDVLAQSIDEAILQCG